MGDSFYGILSIDCDPIAAQTKFQCYRDRHVNEGQCILPPPCDFGSFTLLQPYSAQPEGRAIRGSIVNDERFVVAGSVKLHNIGELQQKIPSPVEYDKDVNPLRLILQAYRYWGEGCVEHLLGNFSFVIWDIKKQELFGAVDHLGIKNLYYTIDRNAILRLADRVETLVAEKGAPLNKDYVLAYLAKCFPLPGQTVYQDIISLPPGSSLSVKEGSVKVVDYWQPSIAKRGDSRGAGEDAASELQAIFFNAVECRLSNTDNNGISLSGGLDSSAIATIAKRHLRPDGRRLTAFAKVVAPEELEENRNENRYIEIVAQQEELTLRRVTGMSHGSLERFHDYYRRRHCFPFNPFPFLTEPLVKECVTNNCPILLTGFGGDETASTYGLTSLALLLKSACLGDLMCNARLFSNVNGLTLWKTVRNFILAPLVPGALKQLYRGLRGNKITASLGNSFVYPAVIQQSAVQLRIKAEDGYLSNRFIDPRKELLTRVKSAYFRPTLDLYEYFYDVHGVRQEHPFLDKRIVELMLAVHPREYLRDGWTRSLFRRAMKGILSEEVRKRKGKTPFNPTFPFSQCLLENADFVTVTLNNLDSTVWEMIDRRRVADAFERVKRGVSAGGAMELNTTALEIGRCINVAAFYQWNGL